MNTIIKFLIDFDPTSFLEDLDIIGLILGAVSEFTILLDILIITALVVTILRGVFKKFWSMTWKFIIFAILFVALLIMSDMIAGYLGALPLAFEVTMDGTTYEAANLFETLQEMARIADPNINAEGFALTFLKNLVIIVGIFPIMIVATIVSLITFPLIRLVLPKRIREMRLRIPSLVLSLVYFFLTLFIFASAADTVLIPLYAFRTSAAFNDQSLLANILRPELIDVLALFTREKSFMLQILDFGNVTRYSPFFQKVDAEDFKTLYTTILEKLNNIVETA
ncbi:MAG TPA: hypothetical protein VFD05_02180 [Bacilli bacterium]|nr:hypothetical protein [Bacilli bacterium]